MTRRTPGTIAARNETRIDALERRYYDLAAFYEYKIYPDPNHPVALADPTAAIVQVGDSQYYICIPRSVQIFRLVEAEASIAAAASGDVEIMIRNGGISGTGTTDMLSTPITIDAGDCSSFFSGAPSVVDTGADEVDLGELVWVDVDADGGGDATGLNIMLRFE
jgi:hypothetical protein